jgi:hypothetical protein
LKQIFLAKHACSDHSTSSTEQLTTEIACTVQVCQRTHCIGFDTNNKDHAAKTSLVQTQNGLGSLLFTQRSTAELLFQEPKPFFLPFPLIIYLLLDFFFSFTA